MFSFGMKKGGRAFVCVAVLSAAAGMVSAQQQSLVSCKPMSQKTGETGCWVLASQPLGTLTDSVYWTIDSFPTRAAAEQANTNHGIVVESLGKIWLLTVGPKFSPTAGGERATQIGPLPVKKGQAYTAQFMEATLEPGMVSKTHVHSGTEVFFTQSGETCLETPNGKQVGKPGVGVIVPEGVPMELTATGMQTRRGMMLILHDATKPPTTVVDTWKSKGLCRAGQ